MIRAEGDMRAPNGKGVWSGKASWRRGHLFWKIGRKLGGWREKRSKESKNWGGGSHRVLGNCQLSLWLGAEGAHREGKAGLEDTEELWSHPLPSPKCPPWG